MQELPTGTVTFLFTDVEGSTKLLHELGERYADVLAEHRRVLRDAFAQHGGVEVDTQGDAFFVAFAKASDALAAAHAGCQALEAGPIRVRMGLHTGEPLVTEEGYTGIDVHRAARIAAAGHGGQILLSQSTRDLAGSDSLRDLGEHRLKDLTAAERIYQFGEDDFPPLRTLDRANLPIVATPLVGRERELAELTGLLRDGARLLTITGAGGGGKTRLALQAAAELADDFHDGVFFVPLAAVQDAALVGSALAQAAGVREPGDLREAEVLLLVDSFEHLLDAAGELSSLLAQAPKVTLVVTSRVRLRIAGEQEFALDPLPLDEAVAFFLERARAVKRDVEPDRAIAEICRRLDGLPLALELAASRVKVLDPPLLLDRLEQGLSLLTGGPRDAPERQQTLRATIEWSYGLLDPPLQQAFRRLSVFAGSFSLEAADLVTGVDLDQIASLVDWSLLKPIGGGRFLMLETLREHAREQLDRSDEGDDLKERHLTFVLELVEQAEPNLTGPDQRQWYDRLALEQDNVREALSYACDTNDGERALLLAGTIWRYWWNRTPVAEASHWYERAFSVGHGASARARARAVFGAAHVAESRGDVEQARAQFEQAAVLFREIGETRWLILALAHLAQAYDHLGDTGRAEAGNNEALGLALKSGDVRGAAVVRGNLGYSLLRAGDDHGARALLEESLQGSRTAEDVYMIASCLANLATLALRAGDLEVAAANLRESLQLFRSIGDAHDLAQVLPIAAEAAFARGNADGSARLCAAAEAFCRAHGFGLIPFERKLLDETVAAVRLALGETFEESWTAGVESELADAVELALSLLEPDID